MAKCLQEEENWLFVFRGILCYIIRLNHLFTTKMKNKMLGGKIADGLQLGSWKEAKLAFTSLRSKYNRRKKNFKDCHCSETSSDRVEKAEKDLKEYSFLFWLDSFIYERKGRSNLPQDEISECKMNGNAEPLEEDVQIEDFLDETFVESDMQTVPISIAENISTASDSPKHRLPNSKSKSKKVKLRKSVEISDTSEKLLQTLKETLHERHTEDIFGTCCKFTTKS